MLAFAACLIGAGALLSLLIRAPGLILALIGFGVALAGAILLRPALGADASVPIALLVAMVALQAGYGLGVVLRAVVASRSERHVRGDRAAREASDPVPQSWSDPHDGRPLNRS